MRHSSSRGFPASRSRRRNLPRRRRGLFAGSLLSSPSVFGDQSSKSGCALGVNIYVRQVKHFECKTLTSSKEIVNFGRPVYQAQRC
ncbi:hypothetical protein SCHPADRAFT_340151 [Schizopora paradoxa]|uniref:Uncharacterized protein n=1 Tax=Schizopora paradoxa TaxID=27342 RepID=A0A0H2RPG9_9AGAM|nr:hypothetical protein SCHPADRAFT_340151 [Schizopora paradoxa]